MVTAEEIRARVEAADKDRIQARADTAAAIAADMERRNMVRAELAEIDAALTVRIAESAAIMTLTELSAFTGIPENELSPPAAPAGGRHGRQPRRKPVGARRTRPAAALPGTTPVTVSSDY